MTAVSVIGLGAMGGRAAARLAADHPTLGYDLSPAAREAAAQQGVQIVDTPEQAAKADVVLLSLPMPADVVAVAEDVLASHLGEGAVVVDLSTIDPAGAQTAAAAVAARGAVYLDAPVLGRPARCGAWTLTAGGDAAAVERVRPLLEATIARAVVRVGDVGAGSVVKLLNNLMFGAINAVTAEVLTICRLAGVDPALFAGTVAESGAATVSGLFRELAPKIVEGDLTPAFALDLLAKDNRLAVALAGASGAPTLIGSAVDQVNRLAVARGYGALDTAAVHRLYADLSADRPA
ncbi:NAD(P)-dependent oxidoreductase [Actinomadura macrotermitis]|uniref:3-hydroxyisobutyrate dehydrogenase n=1 Tax=Actinomadura macrotermitis TaxID=2585200 RepID=A0A7K0BP99_9ACTN|nr:NAD(P)-dependent oxidoreductase [Actinomadura macrotermitis]MQY02682.1 3-hydroxyisobutyrate dehydrogenase [Actinomadura macrotermitis]